MKRFTKFDEREGTYYIETSFNHSFKYKKYVTYRETRPATNYLGEIENLLEKYKVESLLELEKILQSKNNKKNHPKEGD